MTFRLRTLLAAVAAIGIAVYLLLAAPARVAAPGLILVAVASTIGFTAGIVYGRNKVRAFCIGALFPAGATIAALTWLLSAWLLAENRGLADLLNYFEKSAPAFRLWSGACWALQVLGGLLTIAVRAAAGREDL